MKGDEKLKASSNLFEPTSREGPNAFGNQNTYVESFDGRLRDECLNEHRYTNVPHATVVIAIWTREYNEERPKPGRGVTS